MKACPDTATEDAAAPCVEAPRRRWRGPLLGISAVLAAVGLWWGASRWLRTAPIHEPATLRLGTVTRARAPVPLQTVGEISRPTEGNVALVRVEVTIEQGQSFYTVPEADIRPRSLEGRVFVGRVRSTGDKDGKVVLEFEFDVSDVPKLPPGKADVTLVPPGEAPLLVPVTAVVSRESERAVAVVDADGVLSWKTVNLGRELGSQVEVLWGLSEGSRYVLRADPTLQEGARVRAKRN